MGNHFRVVGEALVCHKSSMVWCGRGQEASGEPVWGGELLYCAQLKSQNRSPSAVRQMAIRRPSAEQIIPLFRRSLLPAYIMSHSEGGGTTRIKESS